MTSAERPYDEAALDRWIARVRKGVARGDLVVLALAVADATSDEFLGTVNVALAEGDGWDAEIGFGYCRMPSAGASAP